MLSDGCEQDARLWPRHALLDCLTAAGAAGNLPIGMKSEQCAATKHGLRLLGRACDQVLRQHLVDKRAARVQVLQGARQIGLVAHKPDTAAGGADGRLDDGGKPDGVAQFTCGFHDSRGRLRQTQSIEQPAKCGLAVRDAVAGKTRQRQPGAILQTLPRAGKQKSLFVNRQQHIEMLRGQ